LPQREAGSLPLETRRVQSHAGQDAAGPVPRARRHAAAGRSASIVTNRRQFNFRYRFAAHFIETFRNWYGPLHQAFKVLSPADAAGFDSDLTDLLNRHNRAGSGSLVVPSEYLEVIIVR